MRRFRVMWAIVAGLASIDERWARLFTNALEHAAATARLPVGARYLELAARMPHQCPQCGPCHLALVELVEPARSA